MSKSYIQLTENIKILCGCVCSQCDTTRLILLDAEIITRKNYVFNRSEAEKVAKANADTAQRKIMDILNQITQQKTNIYEGRFLLPVGEDEIPASIILKGIDTPCPVCGHKEPWQVPPKGPEYSFSAMNSIDEHHMPHAWTDASMATNWAVSMANKTLERKQDYWKRYPARKELLLEKRSKVCSLIDLLNLESENFSELTSQYEHQKKIEELEKKSTELRGIERKNIIKEIEYIKDCIHRLKPVIEEKNLAYNSIREELISQKEAIQLQLIGADGIINAKTQDRNIWWQLF